MKNLVQHIQEKLRISSNTLQNEHALFPETKKELKEMIESEIAKNGNECSLNHIDVSEIVDMSFLFSESEFNGDISGWDVSNVTIMHSMFEESKFNGDISKWDVSNVTDMYGMFYGSKFNSDISKWNVSDAVIMDCMFIDCPLQNNPPKWYKE